MDKICAIIDCQGFQLKNGFFPREIAIASDIITQCQEINACIEWDELSDESKQTIFYTTKFLNGLHHYPFNNKNFCFLPKINQIENIINTWYNMVSTDEKQYFGVKNIQMANILTMFNIPFIDLNLDVYNVPNYKTLQEKYNDKYVCAIHKKPRKNVTFTCSLRKVCHLFRYLNEMLENTK